MRATWVVVGVLLSGCYFKAKEHVSRYRIEQRPGREFPNRPTDALTLRLDAVPGTAAITLHATWDRHCRREMTDIFEVKKTYTREFEANADNEVVLFFAILAAPITIPISLATSSRSDSVTHESKPGAYQVYACPAPATNLPVALLLPSGAALAGTTSDAGIATFAVPSTEPARGVVAAGLRADERLSRVTVHAVRYELAAAPTHELAAMTISPSSAGSPAQVVAIAIAKRCAATLGTHGQAALRLGVNGDGVVQRIEIDAPLASLVACIGNELIGTKLAPGYRGHALRVPLELP